MVLALDNDVKALAALGLSERLTFEGMKQAAARIFETMRASLRPIAISLASRRCVSLPKLYMLLPI